MQSAVAMRLNQAKSTLASRGMNSLVTSSQARFGVKYEKGPTGPAQGDITMYRSGPKFNFGDVLIVPKKSFVQSRSRVDIHCEYEFKYSNHKWEGVPIMSSNMAIPREGQLDKNYHICCYLKQK